MCNGSWIISFVRTNCFDSKYLIQASIVTSREAAHCSSNAKISSSIRKYASRAVGCRCCCSNSGGLICCLFCFCVQIDAEKKIARYKCDMNLQWKFSIKQFNFIIIFSTEGFRAAWLTRVKRLTPESE